MERICSKSCEFQEKQNKFEPSPCPGKNLELPRKAEALKTGILFSKEEKKRENANKKGDDQKKDYEKKEALGEKLHFSMLPREMVELVFSFLDPLSIKNVACVSR